MKLPAAACRGRYPSRLPARRQVERCDGDYRRSRQGVCRLGQPAAGVKSAGWHRRGRDKRAGSCGSGCVSVHCIQAQGCRACSFNPCAPGRLPICRDWKPGLVITRVNRQPTGSKSQFDTVVGKLKSGDDVVFEVIDPASIPSRGSITSVALCSPKSAELSRARPEALCNTDSTPVGLLLAGVGS